MNTITRTRTLTIDTPILPELDPALGEQLGDEILLGVALQEKVATVKGGSRRNSRTGQSRAWSMGGNVD